MTWNLSLPCLVKHRLHALLGRKTLKASFQTKKRPKKEERWPVSLGKNSRKGLEILLLLLIIILKHPRLKREWIIRKHIACDNYVLFRRSIKYIIFPLQTSLSASTLNLRSSAILNNKPFFVAKTVKLPPFFKMKSAW